MEVTLTKEERAFLSKLLETAYNGINRSKNYTSYDKAEARVIVEELASKLHLHLSVDFQQKNYYSSYFTMINKD